MIDYSKYPGSRIGDDGELFHGLKVQKMIELFGDRWGRWYGGFSRTEITEDDVISVLDRVYDWYNAPYRHKTACKIIGEYINEREYTDYKLGYGSQQFQRDVAEVLNTIPGHDRLFESVTKQDSVNVFVEVDERVEELV